MTRVPAPIAHSAPFTRCAAGYFLLLGPKFETGGRAKIGGVLVASKPTPPELHGSATSGLRRVDVGGGCVHGISAG